MVIVIQIVSVSLTENMWRIHRNRAVCTLLSGVVMDCTELHVVAYIGIPANVSALNGCRN